MRRIGQLKLGRLRIIIINSGLPRTRPTFLRRGALPPPYPLKYYCRSVTIRQVIIIDVDGMIMSLITRRGAAKR